MFPCELAIYLHLFKQGTKKNLMNSLCEMDTLLTLWKYTFPKAKSFSHKVEEKENKIVISHALTSE